MIQRRHRGCQNSFRFLNRLKTLLWKIRRSVRKNNRIAINSSVNPQRKTLIIVSLKRFVKCLIQAQITTLIVKECIKLQMKNAVNFIKHHKWLKRELIQVSANQISKRNWSTNNSPIIEN